MTVRFSVSADDASTLLWGLVLVNLEQMKRWYALFGVIPSVIHAVNTGEIVYDPRDSVEHWQTFDELVMGGRGDCEDLSAAVTAELLLGGWHARPYVYKSSPTGIHHVVVESEAFGFLDPSVAGGMGRI